MGYTVYCHSNKVNGKRYVGITSQKLSKRFDNGNGHEGCTYFNRAIDKYGWDGFTHFILQDELTREEAFALEKHFIAKWDLMNPEHGYNLTSGGDSGYTRSPESNRKSGECHITHGESKTKLYKIHATMKSKCLNPTDHSYCDYGAKGISVCDDWLEYVPFRDWAMSHGYREGLILGRIDTTKDYNPENCIWTTMNEQHANRSDKVEITYNGETHNLKEWSEIMNVSRATLYSRLNSGWDSKKTLITPIKVKSDGLPSYIETHGNSSYRIRIKRNGKRYYKGQIPTLEEAIVERDRLLLFIEEEIKKGA